MKPTIAAETKRRQLRQRLSEPGLIVAPGVFDMISARIADRMGFDTLYMTGYGAVASYLGLDEALRRMEAYARAGADILFAESPETPEEMARIAKHFDKPVLINKVEGGRTPLLTREELAQMGFKLAIFPATGFLAAGRALERAYGALFKDGSSRAIAGELYEFDAFSRLMDFEAVWEFDRAHAEIQPADQPLRAG